MTLNSVRRQIFESQAITGLQNRIGPLVLKPVRGNGGISRLPLAVISLESRDEIGVAAQSRRERPGWILFLPSFYPDGPGPSENTSILFVSEFVASGITIILVCGENSFRRKRPAVLNSLSLAFREGALFSVRSGICSISRPLGVMTSGQRPRKFLGSEEVSFTDGGKNSPPPSPGNPPWIFRRDMLGAGLSLREICSMAA